MKNILFIFLLLPLSIFAQEKNKASLEREARKLVREGNELYNQEKFSDAEVAYKKALQKDPNSEVATYNLGNALSQQKRGKEALEKYELVAKNTKDVYTISESMHNIGNTVFQEKNYQKAVESYKNSLRANPNDDETRYNLALAQKMLKDQQQKNKDDKKDKDKDKKDDKKDKDKKDDKKEGDDKKGDDKKKDDKKDDKDDKKDDKKEGDDKKDKNNPNKDKKDEKQKQQPQQGKLSPQQVKQLLDAMNNEEQKTQKKMNAKKERGRKIKQEKDW